MNDSAERTIRLSTSTLITIISIAVAIAFSYGTLKSSVTSLEQVTVGHAVQLEKVSKQVEDLSRSIERQSYEMKQIGEKIDSRNQGKTGR